MLQCELNNHTEGNNNTSPWSSMLLWYSCRRIPQYLNCALIVPCRARPIIVVSSFYAPSTALTVQKLHKSDITFIHHYPLHTRTDPDGPKNEGSAESPWLPSHCTSPSYFALRVLLARVHRILWEKMIPRCRRHICCRRRRCHRCHKSQSCCYCRCCCCCCRCRRCCCCCCCHCRRRCRCCCYYCCCLSS